MNVIFHKSEYSPSGGPGGCIRLWRQRRAFSLIELMVVVGIIGLLLMLAFPALNNARQAARLTKCASNLRQWGTAIQLYMAENDGFLPQSVEVAGVNSSGWQEKIAPYLVGNRGAVDSQRFVMREMFRCPGDKSAYGTGIVYGSNDYLRPAQYNKAPKKIGLVTVPLADFMILGENFTAELWNANPGPTWNTAARVDYTRHGPKQVANFLFGDFHVEALSYQDTVRRPMLFVP